MVVLIDPIKKTTTLFYDPSVEFSLLFFVDIKEEERRKHKSAALEKKDSRANDTFQ